MNKEALYLMIYDLEYGYSQGQFREYRVQFYEFNTDTFIKNNLLGAITFFSLNLKLMFSSK